MSLQLSMRHVRKSFDQQGVQTSVFLDTSIDFEQGKSYAIMGVSGSGKSTAIALLAGIEQPDAGHIVIGDQNLVTIFAQQGSQAFFYDSVGLVLQQPLLFAELTVLENVMIKAMFAGSVDENSYELAHELLQEIGLADKADAYPVTLSGGQQQRVAILRAIFVVPKFLLVDEPTGNLDDETAEQVVDLLLHYQKKYGMGLIMSTHNQQLADRLEHLVHVENKKLILKS